MEIFYRGLLETLKLKECYNNYAKSNHPNSKYVELALEKVPDARHLQINSFKRLSNPTIPKEECLSYASIPEESFNS